YVNTSNDIGSIPCYIKDDGVYIYRNSKIIQIFDSRRNDIKFKTIVHDKRDIFYALTTENEAYIIEEYDINQFKSTLISENVSSISNDKIFIINGYPYTYYNHKLNKVYIEYVNPNHRGNILWYGRGGLYIVD